MGRSYSSDATIAQVDIAAVYNDEVILIAEVEEGTGTSIKTILSDVFGIVICDRMKIGKKIYLLRDVALVVAQIVKPTGKREEKLARLERNLKVYLDTLHAPDRPRGKSVSKIRLVSAQANTIVDKSDRLIRQMVNKRVRGMP